MNRIILYILATAFLFANSANSQLFNSKTKNTALKSKVVAKEASPTSNVKDENQIGKDFDLFLAIAIERVPQI